MEINVQEKITCKRQKNGFLSNKYISHAITYTKRYKHQKWTLKNY